MCIYMVMYVIIGFKEFKNLRGSEVRGGIRGKKGSSRNDKKNSIYILNF